MKYERCMALKLTLRKTEFHGRFDVLAKILFIHFRFLPLIYNTSLKKSDSERIIFPGGGTVFVRNNICSDIYEISKNKREERMYAYSNMILINEINNKFLLFLYSFYEIKR